MEVDKRELLLRLLGHVNSLQNLIIKYKFLYLTVVSNQTGSCYKFNGYFLWQWKPSHAWETFLWKNRFLLQKMFWAYWFHLLSHHNTWSSIILLESLRSHSFQCHGCNPLPETNLKEEICLMRWMMVMTPWWWPKEVFVVFDDDDDDLFLQMVQNEENIYQI